MGGCNQFYNHGSPIADGGRRRHRSAPTKTLCERRPAASRARPVVRRQNRLIRRKKANLIWVLTCLQRPHAYYSAANQSRESDVTIQGGQGRARMLSLTRCKKLKTIFKKTSLTRDKSDTQFRHFSSDRSGDKCQYPFAPIR